MLTIKGVSRRFGGKLAVDDVPLKSSPGSSVGVMERSGVGKSTLLRIVDRLVKPPAGSIAFGSVDVTALRGRAPRDWRSRCAMAFRPPDLFSRLGGMPTARALLRLWRRADVATALSAPERFDIAPHAGQRAGSSSGGQQRRAAIACAIVQPPSVILADEPFASLAPHDIRIVTDALQRLDRHHGITVLRNLHSFDLARSCCDRLGSMAADRVAFDGPAFASMAAAARDLHGLEADEALGAPERSPVDAFRAAALA